MDGHSKQTKKLNTIEKRQKRAPREIYTPGAMKNKRIGVFNNEKPSNCEVSASYSKTFFDEKKQSPTKQQTETKNYGTTVNEAVADSSTYYEQKSELHESNNKGSSSSSNTSNGLEEKSQALSKSFEDRQCNKGEWQPQVTIKETGQLNFTRKSKSELDNSKGNKGSRSFYQKKYRSFESKSSYSKDYSTSSAFIGKHVGPLAEACKEREHDGSKQRGSNFKNTRNLVKSNSSDKKHTEKDSDSKSRLQQNSGLVNTEQRKTTGSSSRGRGKRNLDNIFIGVRNLTINNSNIQVLPLATNVPNDDNVQRQKETCSKNQNISNVTTRNLYLSETPKKSTSASSKISKKEEEDHTEFEISSHDTSMALLTNQELQNQLEEEIKPMKFINSSDDELNDNYIDRNSGCNITDDLKQKSQQNASQKDRNSIQSQSRNNTVQESVYEQNLHHYWSSRTAIHQRDMHEIHSNTHSDNASHENIPSLLSNCDSKLISIRPSDERVPQVPVVTRQLFNPTDPSKPFVVPITSRNTRVPSPSVYGAAGTEDGYATLSNSVADGVDGSTGDIDELLHNINKGECDIQYYVNSNQIPREFARIMDIRVYLQKCYIKLFSTSISLCHKKNVESQMWKTLYYTIIGEYYMFLGSIFSYMLRIVGFMC